MKFYLISQRKLKVWLTARECAEYGIKITDGEFEGGGIRRLLSTVLKRAADEVGFSLDESRSLVQLYPTEDGSFEMLVTKLKGSESERLEGERLMKLTKSEGLCYYPLTAEQLRQITSIKGLKNSRAELYKERGGAYLLRLPEGFTVDGEPEGIIEEFCDGAKIIFPVLCEYFERIGDVATVEELGRLI